MAKTKSQRMKEYRARKKEQLGDEWLKRENERVKGYFIPISELSDRKQTHKRVLNRMHCETYRKKRKMSRNKLFENEHVESEANSDIQPSTSSADEYGVSSTTSVRTTPLTVKMNFSKQVESLQSRGRESRGRKRASRALAKQYRKNQKLEDELETAKRKLNTARKRLNRYDAKQRSNPSTPRSKSDKVLRDAGIEPEEVPEVRRRVLFAECVSEEIKEAKQANDQNIVKRIVCGRVMKKYKMKQTLSTSTSLNRRKLNNVTKSVAHITKRSRNAVFNKMLTRDILEFLEREDNSRILPGKADAVKEGKFKVQKRVLNDYLYNLHVKFQAESTYTVSRSTFYKMKPQSIAHVNFSSRSVCLCQKHQNFALKLRCLKNYKVSSITSPDKFMETCRNHDELEAILLKLDATTVRYQEWKRKKMKDGKQKMRVIDIEVPKGEFIAMMKNTYTEFASHIHKVVAQYSAVKQMRERLPKDQALVQMDFSENYSCQNMEEVQSAYWNATAVTLHPTVFYKTNEEGKLEHKSIVYVSEVLQHNAAMVLAIVDKVTESAKNYVNELKAIHFWTDSPTSQYRNKTVFEFLSSMESVYGIKGSWQYFESGHGKGPCDGIGGTTKRNADNAIKQGKVVIQDADDFFKWATETDSQIEYVKISQEEFDLNKERVERDNSHIKPIKGTMKIHSVVAVSPGNVRTRETTCTCDNCFTDNGFSEDSQCVWLRQSLRKPIRENACSSNDICQSEVENTEIENPVSPVSNAENSVGETANLKENDYVVVVYNEKRYIGQITDVDDEENEVEVNCMEECSKVQGRYKWPRNSDSIWLNKGDVLKIIDAPMPTGRSKRIFSVDEGTSSFMKANE